jgi:6-phospho-beta-glucosidase
MSLHAKEDPILCLLGGSSVATPVFIEKLAEAAQADGDLVFREIRLYGRSQARLDQIARYCSGLIARSENPKVKRTRLSSHMTLESALAGADVVICQVRVGGMSGRRRDEEAALAAGVPGDETWGPAGLSNHLRGRAVLDRFTAAWLRFAPDAVFLQMVSPLDLAVGRARRRFGGPAYGVCELPATTAEQVYSVARAHLGVELVRHAHAGLNHASWLYGFEDASGLDHTGRVVEAFAEHGGSDVEPHVIRQEAAAPVPYLRLAYHRDREQRRQAARSLSRGAELELWAARLERLYGDTPFDIDAIEGLLGQRQMNWYADGVIPALQAFRGSRSAGGPIALNLPNLGEAVPGIHALAVVEAPCIVERATARPLPQRPLPPGPAALLRDLVAYQDAVLALPDHPDLAAVADVIAAHPWRVTPSKACANYILGEWELGERLGLQVT